MGLGFFIELREFTLWVEPGLALFVLYIVLRLGSGLSCDWLFLCPLFFSSSIDMAPKVSFRNTLCLRSVGGDKILPVLETIPFLEGRKEDTCLSEASDCTWTFRSAFFSLSEITISSMFDIYGDLGDLWPLEPSEISLLDLFPL